LLLDKYNQIIKMLSYKIISTKKITSFLILVSVLFYTNSFPQVNYGFSATTRAYVPVSGGITPPFINIPYDYNLDVAASSDEGLGDSIPIGFTFNYNGVNHNYINIDANG
jgi:hypothetical protein